MSKTLIQQAQELRVKAPQGGNVLTWLEQQSRELEKMGVSTKNWYQFWPVPTIGKPTNQWSSNAPANAMITNF